MYTPLKTTHKRWAIRVRKFVRSSQVISDQPYLIDHQGDAAPGAASTALFKTQTEAEARCKQLRVRRKGYRVTATPVPVTVTICEGWA